jgi:conjugal transfer pilus assembly protein TraF
MVSHFKMYARISLLGFTLLFFAIQTVEASFYQDKARGWFWYEDAFLEEEDDVQEVTQTQKEKKEESVQTQMPTTPNYVEQLQKYKKTLEDKKAKALMSPTYSHVKEYMTAQKDMSDRASFFSEQWKRVVLTTPALNPEIDNPTSHYISHVKKDEERMARQAVLASMGKTYGLFLFVSNNCSYCKAFAPVVNAFAKKYGFEVIVISLQGLVDADIEALFPTIWNNNGIAETFGIQQAPALMAYSKHDDDLIPITYGATSLDTLETNLMALMQPQEKDDCYGTDESRENFRREV